MLQRLDQKRRELAREMAALERAQRAVLDGCGEELLGSWDPSEALLALVLQGGGAGAPGGSRAFKRARVGGGNSSNTVTTVGWSAAASGAGGAQGAGGELTGNDVGGVGGEGLFEEEEVVIRKALSKETAEGSRRALSRETAEGSRGGTTDEVTAGSSGIFVGGGTSSSQLQPQSKSRVQVTVH